MKLLESTKSEIIKNKNGENVYDLKITEVALVHCNIIENDYEQDWRVLDTFIPNKLFGQLLDISPKHSMFLKTFNIDIPYIEAWFTDQNSKPLEMTRYSIETKDCGKIISKNFSSKEITMRKFLIILSNLPHMHLKLLQKKKQFKT